MSIDTESPRGLRLGAHVCAAHGTPLKRVIGAAELYLKSQSHSHRALARCPKLRSPENRFNGFAALRYGNR
jgi:hypothetical protein